METAKPTTGAPKAYDKDLIKDEVVAVCFHYLGPGRRQGVRFVWRCPDCGKAEKFAANASKNVCGCLNADCGMPQTMDSLALIANREQLELSGYGFRSVLERGYEILNLPHPPEGNSRPTQEYTAARKAKASSSTAGHENGTTQSSDNPSFSSKGGTTFTRAEAAPPSPNPSPDHRAGNHPPRN